MRAHDAVSRVPKPSQNSQLSAGENARLTIVGKEYDADFDAGPTWAEWKAAKLNRVFQEQGVLRKPARITAVTVLHGEHRTP
jgi:hypothetical protein